MSERRPAELFPPGEYIKDELVARGWTQTDLAHILDRPFPAVNEIVAAKRRITRDTAIGLGEAFGTGPEIWLSLESAYRLGQAGEATSDVARRARAYELAPVREMMRRKWIGPAKQVGQLEDELKTFFEIDSLSEDPPAIPHAARRSGSDESLGPSLRAWLYRTRTLARSAPVAAVFADETFARATAQLARLRQDVAETRHVATVLADCGIRLLVVEHLKGTHIDGTCFWLDAASPVVAVSLRYDRLDWFWFTLMHELGHVRRRDGLETAQSVDVNLVGAGSMSTDTKPLMEQEADRFAADFLVPQQELEGFIVRVGPLYSKTRIRGFAARLGVHPALVLGQLARRGEVSYSHSREMLVKVRSGITDEALTDGWGHVVAG